MKSLNKSYLFFAAAAIFAVGACKKDNQVTTTKNQPATVSFTVNGDGYTNKTISIAPGASDPENEAVYFSKWNFTRGSVTDGKMKFTLYTDGKKTGKQLLGTEFNNTTGPYTAVSILMDLDMADNEEKKYLYQENTFGGNPLPPGSSITITAYGANNEFIEGDFQGALFNTLNDKIITITNGHFKIPRGSDVK